jgi:hypothetical protein
METPFAIAYIYKLDIKKIEAIETHMKWCLYNYKNVLQA